MSQTSRTGRSISRRACDLCRERKTQCVFNDPGDAECQKCVQANAPCTFLSTRKPRGPPSRRVAEARQRAILGTAPYSVQSVQGVQNGPLELPAFHLTIAHFVPQHVFQIIVDDFFERVYPVLPLVDTVVFKRRFEQRDYDTDPAFFRLCVSICAITVASLQRKLPTYADSWYSTVEEIVDKAVQLVLLSRIVRDAQWQNHPTIDGMIVSTMLALATHYGGRPVAGWGFASEAIQFFRALELEKKESYAQLSAADAELSKRTSWILFMLQAQVFRIPHVPNTTSLTTNSHDRISHLVPHTGLSYSPSPIVWDFLMPQELFSEQILDETWNQSPKTPNSDRPPPLISGFVGLIKVFLSVADILHRVFPGAPHAYSLGHQPNLHGSLSNGFNSSAIKTLSQGIERLKLVIHDLPPHLKFPHQLQQSDEKEEGNTGNLPIQFEIMRANIHITALYLQSMILEMYLVEIGKLNTGSPHDDNSSAINGNVANLDEYPANDQLWQMKESVAEELLKIVHSCSSWALESNGLSMIQKIREIAVTLLQGSEELEVSGDVKTRMRNYITQFLDVLSILDCSVSSPNGSR